MNLTKEDLLLIEKAREAIKPNYDGVTFKHTVGCALRTKSGKIYVGVNVYSIHGACGEVIAIGNAITNGEREFDTIVAVAGDNNYNVIPPCGNCRQLLSDYMNDGYVIVDDETKVKVSELLPYPYECKF